jgi:hypothetical protein
MNKSLDPSLKQKEHREKYASEKYELLNKFKDISFKEKSNQPTVPQPTQTPYNTPNVEYYTSSNSSHT